MSEQEEKHGNNVFYILGRIEAKVDGAKAESDRIYNTVSANKQEIMGKLGNIESAHTAFKDYMLEEVSKIKQNQVRYNLVTAIATFATTLVVAAVFKHYFGG